MRLHSDTLTTEDLYTALPRGVQMHCTPKGSKKRARAFEVTLYVWGKDSLHAYYGNSGGYGASDEVAATWDEWGVWMVNLYEIDNSALIGYYRDRFDFNQQTARTRDSVRMCNKPGSLRVRTHTAPWLDGPAARLEYLRGCLRAESISYGELAELEDLAEHIDPSDVELLEAAGVPEFPEEVTA